VQPGNTQSGSRFLLTVDALLNLKNALGYGETIAAVFQQLQPGSPRFNFKVEYPYIYNTPFSMDVNFDLYKKDTLFNRVTIDIGLKYLLNHRDYVRIAYVNNANRVIAPDINFVKANKRLPNSIDVTNGGLNLGFNLDNTDYALNPRRGYYVQGQLQYLNRKIIKNAAITSIIDGSGFDYTAIYDTLSLLNRQSKAQVSLGLYIPATKQIVLKLAYNGAYLSGDNLFLNELFQIGGFNLLRGFDEMSLFVNHYQILTAELRLLFNVNSYFYVFSDNAYIQAKYNQIQNSNYPMGLGLGINLENQGGVFKIAVGVGKLEASNFMLRQAKLHFGYVAYF
jgi:outer membrane protein assembly factor BamA